MTYDENDYPTAVQRQWVERLLRSVTPGGSVLDAPCGTGRYFEVIAEAGLRVVGIDQSSGMLAQARSRGIASSLEQLSLQELSYDGQFDAVMTVDAMENAPPEDWALVLANLHRSAKPGALIYMTVEEIDRERIDEAFTLLVGRDAPAVWGEVTEGDVASYHYYPTRDQISDWFADEDLQIVEEDFNQEDGWGYRHFLLRGAEKRAGPVTRAPR